MILDNIIYIKGGAYDDVKKALRQWIDLYSKDLEEDLTFELIKNGRGNHVIKADARLDNDSFYFLVNYLHYPEGIDYKAEIEGFATGSKRDVLKDRKLLVYVSPNDKEGDNVFVTTSDNRSYKVGFNGRISEEKETKVFRLPAEQNFSQSEFLTVNKKEDVPLSLEKLEGEVVKRFKIIFSITIAAFTLNLLIPQFFHNYEILEPITWCLFWGVGFWFFSDYEMLRFDKYFFRCILIALGVLGYEYIITRFLYVDSHECPLVLYPLILLLIQWPTRQLYIFIFRREPKIEKNGGEFADRVYSMIIFIVPFLTIFFMIEK